MNMYQKCFIQLEHAIANWANVDVRTVPNVMYQIRFGCDLKDSSIDYQLNWFIDCTETLIHNHRHSFDTLCLEGEYIETSWDVVDDQTDNITYKLRRKSDGTLDKVAELPGVLRPTKIRRHFPGNKMHVNTKLYHSITPTGGPVEEIRSATAAEREKIFDKLQEILLNKSQLLVK